MCGIWFLANPESSGTGMDECINNFMKIAHRGPDASKFETDKRIKNCYLGFHRLSIVDAIHGMQPMKIHKFPMTILLCNGELYNYKQIEQQQGFQYETHCDVECILHLYHKYGVEYCVKNLDAEFAFVLIDMDKQKIIAARDLFGVRPMFKLTSSTGILGFSSEAKGLIGFVKQQSNNKYIVKPFPPGTYEEYDLLKDGMTKLVRSHRFYLPGEKPSFEPLFPYNAITDDTLLNIRQLLTTAVKKRLMSNRRVGCYLSGGLDSSLVASILVRESKREGVPYNIQTFTIGMNGSPDVAAAKKVADFIGSEHNVIEFTEQDVETVLNEVIYTLETPDITTIRASIGMYLISKYIIKNTDTTVLLSGEGADEVCQGYIYFRDSPNAKASHEESLRLLNELYLFDGLRADRTSAANSLEIRLPFLDLQFTNYYLSLNAETRRPKDNVEKFLLRQAFASENLLPDTVLWRPKEAFSDGVCSVSKSLFEIIQDIIEKRIPEKFNFEAVKKQYPHCTPKTKEALYYRRVFEKCFPNSVQQFFPHYWMPRWIEGVKDPSARFISHYSST